MYSINNKTIKTCPKVYRNNLDNDKESSHQYLDDFNLQQRRFEHEE